jgi:hypothetical protein
MLREWATLCSAPSLNRESSDFFCSNSSYLSETNVVAKAINSTINQIPCIALAKPVEINRTLVFHPFQETNPPSNGQLGLFKMQLTMSVRAEVNPLGLKLKAAILSIHS